MQTEVKAVKHVDVRGKELLYITIGEGLNQIIINVGKKTYETVKTLTETGKATGTELKVKAIEK